MNTATACSAKWSTDSTWRRQISRSPTRDQGGDLTQTPVPPVDRQVDRRSRVASYSVGRDAAV